MKACEGIKMYDIIVIGGGPAGLTAAIYARRADKSVLIIEKDTFGGQVTYSPKIENYPGFTEMSGNEFADRLLDQVLGQGAEIELGRVVRIENGDVKRVVTEDGEFEARTVIIAVGVRHRMLGAPGEEELVGHGISFCAVCDGAFYKGRDVAVIGGGNSALQEALLLAETSKSVTVVQNLDYLTGEARLQTALSEKENVNVICGAVVKEFEKTDGVLTGLIVTGKDGSLLAQREATEWVCMLWRASSAGSYVRSNANMGDPPQSFIPGPIIPHKNDAAISVF